MQKDNRFIVTAIIDLFFYLVFFFSVLHRSKSNKAPGGKA